MKHQKVIPVLLVSVYAHALHLDRALPNQGMHNFVILFMMISAVLEHLTYYNTHFALSCVFFMIQG